MSAARRIVRFGKGGLIGAGLGGAMALILAPASGEGLRQRLRAQMVRAKLAGLEAQAAKTSELARRFRERVNDPAALIGVESAAQLKVDQAAAALRAIEASAMAEAPNGRLPGAAGT